MVGVEREAMSVSTTLMRVTDELVFVSMTAACLEIDLDLHERSMDRSMCTGTRARDALNAGKLVRREVVYCVTAEDMEEAVQKFHGSAQAALEILFVIKTETAIYLAQ
jgi:hypothetical protein